MSSHRGPQSPKSPPARRWHAVRRLDGSAPLSRRTILRGLLGGAAIGIGLPPLDAFFDDHGERWLRDPFAPLLPRRAHAEGADGFPVRFGLFFWGNGTLPERWTPKGEGAGDAWQLSEQLAPLAAFKKKLCVVSGTRLGVPNSVPHFAGAAGILSGRPVKLSGTDHTFGGPSIDQIIAAVAGKETRFGSLELAVEGNGLSYNGPNSQNPVEKSPHKAFARLFGKGFTLPGEDPIPDPTVGLRRSILDAVATDCEQVRSKLGASDQLRLQAHLDAVRNLEKRLAKLEDDPPNLAACKLPTQPAESYPDIEGRPQLVVRSQIMAELAAMALACDQTRVVSHWLTHPVSNVLFKGATSGHHQLTHDEPGDQPEVHAIVLQCMQMAADYLKALDAIPEGKGTLLDHMAVLLCSEVSLGKTHSLEEMPVVIAGSASGKLKTDLHYRSKGGENTSKALMSIVRACGVDAATFGADDGLTKDGLAAIEA